MLGMAIVGDWFWKSYFSKNRFKNKEDINKKKQERYEKGTRGEGAINLRLIFTNKMRSKRILLKI